VSGTKLNRGAFITIALGDVGHISLKEGSNPATLTVADDTTSITTGRSGSTVVAIAATGTGTGIVTGSNATGELGVNATANFVVTAAADTAASAYLVSILGTSSAAGTLSANDSGTATVTLDKDFTVDADGT
jgi:Tfp pilus assembly protein PilW